MKQHAQQLQARAEHLSRYRIKQRPNGAKTSSNRLGIDNVSATYDRALIFGALLWLASALKQPDNTVVLSLSHDLLRRYGIESGEKLTDTTI